ncbi:MAG TPA: SRPBCC family protein [Acidimicrobiia bacterium]
MPNTKDDHIAEASMTIDAPANRVWQALVDPKQIKQYMFGSEVTSDWKPGSLIRWKGTFEGKPYEDKGRILEVNDQRRLMYTHYSPLSGEPDRPESYHTVAIDLTAGDGSTTVKLTQDNNKDEEARKHSEENWETMLKGLKELVESD